MRELDNLIEQLFIATINLKYNIKTLPHDCTKLTQQQFKDLCRNADQIEDILCTLNDPRYIEEGYE
jgi:hypothetical protein